MTRTLIAKIPTCNPHNYVTLAMCEVQEGVLLQGLKDSRFHLSPQNTHTLFALCTDSMVIANRKW
jgi:hypothetical protein